MTGQPAAGLAGWMGAPGQLAGSSAESLFNSRTLSDVPGNAITGMPSFSQGTVHPDQTRGIGVDPKGEMTAQLQNGNSVPMDQVDTKGRGPRLAPDGRQPLPDGEGVLNGLPQYQAAQELAQNDPEQAKGFFSQIWDTAKGWVTGEGKNEVNSLMQNGTLTPEGQQKSRVALTAEGYDWNQAGEIISKMDGWDQLGLWGGLGLAGIGLVHAMSGGGGLASLIMTLLGLGTVGFTAGKAGLLDQGAQDLTQGLTDGAAQVTGQAPKGMNIPGLTQALPGVIDHIPDAALTTMLRQVPSMSPDIASQLDRAAGSGSWGNSVLGWLGDVSGMRQQQMKDKLGLNPQQQDRVLKLWSQLRD
jgi:hypothetical protein